MISNTAGIVGSAAGAPQGRRPLLDQENADVFSSLLNGGSADYEWQQGVTAGVTGQLTRIALFVDYSDSAGEPAATQVSVTLGAPWQSGVPAWRTTTVLGVGWTTFNLTGAKIFVVTGDEFTIGIHGQSAHNFNPGFGFSYGDQYQAGELFMNGSTVGSEGNDLLFRTYVKP
jgi:hypothetical protein